MKKWVPNFFYPHEFAQSENYLENQAAKGWILEQVGLLIADIVLMCLSQGESSKIVRHIWKTTFRCVRMQAGHM